MTIQLTISINDMKRLRPYWSNMDCEKFLLKYHDPIFSSLSQYGRELLENFAAIEDIEKGSSV